MAKNAGYPLSDNPKSPFVDQYNKSSDSEKGYKDKMRIMEGEAYTPPFNTLGFDQPILGMDDLDKMRRNKLKKFTK